LESHRQTMALAAPPPKGIRPIRPTCSRYQSCPRLVSRFVRLLSRNGSV
jgi:hypothetical protein